MADSMKREETEAQLRRLSQAVEQSPISLVITDLQAHIEYVNAAFTRASGYTLEEVRGKNPRILQSGKTLSSTYDAMWAQLTGGQSWQGEVINRNKAGREYTEWVLIYPLRNRQGQVTHYLAHKEDITEKKKAMAQIQQLMDHDQLTGLPNRQLLGRYFEQSMAHGHPIAVLWVDLDHFKTINDVLGHQVGDILLLEITHRLRALLRPSDVLSRHAGDAFIAVLAHTDTDGAAAAAQHVLEAFAQPFALPDQEVVLTASVGIALFPGDAQQFDALLQNAEIAMYRVKDEGRNHYCFFAPEMQARTARNLALGQALKTALAHQELHLVYQPQKCLKTGHIVGAEALLRWNSAQWGAVSPGEFIPIAEHLGLITSIGEWVLRQALLQLRAWLDAGLAPMTMAVNLSALQFQQPDLLSIVTDALAKARLPAHCLELELTEAIAMKNPELAAQRIATLNKAGVQLSIDDFGTGYSSLSYLKRFPLDKLKIDQSFIRDVDFDPEDQAITTAVIQLARSLGLKTIAEGVETAAQQAFLRQRGCDEIQGYHFSRPLAPDAFFTFAHKALIAPTNS